MSASVHQWKHEEERPAFHFHSALLIFVNLWVANIDIVCGRYGACCGRYCFWPISFVADMVCGRYHRFPTEDTVKLLIQSQIEAGSSKQAGGPGYLFQ